MSRTAVGPPGIQLGERLAGGELASLAEFDLARDTRVELAAICPLHADPRHAWLLQQLAAPALLSRVEALMLERRGTRARPAAQPT